MLTAATGFDFLFERYRDPSWIGGAFQMMLNPPPGTALLVAIVGLVLIYWTTKPKAVRMSIPVLGMLLSVISLAGFGVWYLVQNQSDLGKISASQSDKAPAPQPKPEPKRYTAYEKEQRLRAIDEIYNAIATQLQPAYNEGRKVVYGIYKAVDANSEQHLTEYAAKVQAAFDGLNALLKKYNYFTDIVQAATKNTFNDVAATHGARNLVPELQQLRAKAPNDIQWLLLRNTTMLDAINQINAFERYLNETLPLLQKKRAEIEASDFSIPVTTPTETPGKKSDLEWNLEGNPDNVNFLGLSMGSSGLQAHNFQTRGWNKTLNPIRSPRAYIRAENTAAEYDGFFNPGNGKLVQASQVEVIPVGATLDIIVPFAPDRKPIPLNKFLSEFVPFTFIFESPDVSFRQTISKEQVAHRIRVYQEAINEKLMTRPVIQVRSNSDGS